MLSPKETGDLAGNIIETAVKGVKIIAVLTVLLFLTGLGLAGTVLYLILTRI